MCIRDSFKGRWQLRPRSRERQRPIPPQYDGGVRDVGPQHLRAVRCRSPERYLDQLGGPDAQA
eukprot:5913307-Alexandrium_andersonii.AAC.1